MPYQDPTKWKEYYEKNKEKKKEQQKEYYEQNKEKKQEYQKKRHNSLIQNAYDSITNREINDRKKWNAMCNKIKRDAANINNSYSIDFTNDIMFEMMIKRCFYCDGLATTIDRLDSKLSHTVDNCVGCCYGCNMSKNTSDPATFVRKAYYRIHKKYYDNETNIWFINKQKPRIDMYKKRAKKQGVYFELTKEYFDELIVRDCKYCQRSPITWFGIDRVVPSEGYVINNVEPCCWDCNHDKLEDNVDTMFARNERIANRVDTLELNIGDYEKYEKMIIH